MNNQKIVEFTLGISGSGKSYYANQLKLKQVNPDSTAVIERDEIREQIQPGYWKQAPNSKFEKVVTETQRLQLSKALADDSVNHIIISDTNLNPAYIEDLQSYAKYQLFILGKPSCEFLTTTMKDSYDLNLCIKRNRARDRKVPEEVICQQYKRFLALQKETAEFYSLRTDILPVVFVSDIHGLYQKMSDIIEKYSRTHTIIFSGDLNDPHEVSLKNPVSSFDCIEILRWNRDHSNEILCLHSNHQKNLIRLIRGKRRKLSHGLNHTANEFQSLGLIKYELDANGEVAWVQPTEKALEIANFLDTLPSCIRLIHNNEEWRLAHAYTPSEQKDFQPYPKKDEVYIYGPTDQGSRTRVEWWHEKENEEVDFKRACGHYHYTFLGKNSVVNDPNESDKIGLVFFEHGKEPYMEFV